MAESFKVLAQSLVPNSATVIYTVPGGTQAIIRRQTIVNPAGSGDVDVTLWVNGSTDANLILAATTIPDGGHAEDDAPLTLDDGDTLLAMGSVNNALTITLHGLEIS